jgi:hypothetical protein
MWCIILGKWKMTVSSLISSGTFLNLVRTSRRLQL